MAHHQKILTVLGTVIGALILVLCLWAAIANYHKRTNQVERHSPNITTAAFIKKIAPAAQREQRRYHIPASITIAQAGLESNWGRSRLAAKYNNLFGIKATSKTDRVKMTTTENVKGKTIEVKQYFQTYRSWADSINAHTQLIVNGTADNHARFRNVQTASNYRQAAVALQKGGYATDPNYANKLIYAIQKFHLDKYDRK